MGLTTNYQLRWPEPTDAVRNGAAAVRLLAEDVEARLMHTHMAQILAADPAHAVPAGGTMIPFPGSTQLAAFALEAGGTLLRYGGPQRLFIVAADVVLKYDGTADGVVSSAQLLVEGVNVLDTVDEVRVEQDTPTPPYVRDRTVSHSLILPMFLGYGQAVQVRALADPGMTCVRSQIRVYPIGPVLP